MRKLLLSSVVAALAFCNTANAQWSDSGLEIWDGSNTEYGYTVKTNNDGVTYAFFHKVLAGGYPMVINVIDKDGNILTGDEGLTLSNEANKSWTVVNEDMTIDVNGNAIVSVLDQRFGGGETYTIYKVGPDGKLIWGDVTLNNSEPTQSNYGMRVCPTSDGGAIFAYASYGDASQMIMIEKLSKDGDTEWQEKLYDPDGQVPYSYPYLADVGENQTMLFYAEGVGSIVKARLIDMDGSNAWGEDITCYRGGFGSMPLWTQFAVGEGPEGGVIAWQQESGFNNYDNRLLYLLKDDGSFAFSEGEGGTIISNDNDNSRQVPVFYWDDEADAFYLAYRIYNQAYQSYVGVYVQKMSREGELLWGPNGYPVVDVQNEMQVLTPRISNGPDGKMAVFYQTMDGQGYSGPVKTNYVLIDKDGNMSEPVNITQNDETKNDLFVSPLIDGDHWIVSWSESLGGDKNKVFLQWLNVDGTLTTISETVVSAPSNDKQMYSLDGRKLNSEPKNGVYISNGKKLLVK